MCITIAGAASCSAGDEVTDVDLEERSLVVVQTSLDGSVAIAASDAGDARVPPPPPPPVTLTPPDGAYSLDVTASGVGCSPGTWRARIVSNGEIEFQLRDLGIALDRRQRIAVKECTLALRLRSATGRAFAVRRLEAIGYAYLEQDVRARVDARAVFPGTTAPDVSGRAEVVGPYDATLSVRSEPPADARLWSVCSIEHTLQVRELVRLVNSEPPRTGYLNIGGIDAAGRKLGLALEDRPCDVPSAGEERTPDGEQTVR